mgnify:CR=1 FL=1|tara:strand:+ start:258 stop:530 length:273 start_codon:yes stop_codon:yes gene_type:complete
MNTSRENRKAFRKGIEAYHDFMRLKASAREIVEWIAHNAARGCDWRGCTKASMAQAWGDYVSSGDEGYNYGITTPPFERLKEAFGAKSKY